MSSADWLSNVPPRGSLELDIIIDSGVRHMIPGWRILKYSTQVPTRRRPGKMEPEPGMSYSQLSVGPARRV